MRSIPASKDTSDRSMIERIKDGEVLGHVEWVGYPESRLLILGNEGGEGDAAAEPEELDR